MLERSIFWRRGTRSVVRSCTSYWWMTLCWVTLSTSTVAAQGGDPPLAPANEPSPQGGPASQTEPADAAVPTGGSSLIEIPTSTTPATEEDESHAASQVASFAVTQLKDSPAVVTVISGEDIRMSGARDLVDILMTVPGYFIGVDTLGVVGPGFRGLWGHEGKILLMIDGKEMNELLFSSMQLGNEFPVELIERVEVLRGPGSVIYGGSAELSVINVITRGLQGSTDAAVTGTYGQLPGAGAFSTGYGRRRATLSGRYVVDAVPGLSTFVSASTGQGQRSVRNFVDNSGISASMEGQSALNPTIVQAGVGYKDIQASFLYHHLALTTISDMGKVSPVDSVTFDAFHGEVVGNFRPTNRLEIVPRFNVTYQIPWRDTSDPTSEAYYDKAVRRLRGRLLGRWAALDQLQVTLGGDAIFDEAHLRSSVGGGLQVPFTANGSDQISYQTYGGYIELFSENPVVNVAVGARYDHQSTVGGALVPRLVLLRTFGPVSLKGLFSLSFRAPGIENLNIGTNIRPERTRVFEFEGAIDITPEQRVSANVFDLSIDSPIAYTVDPVTGNEGYLNLGRQGTRGFEIAYRLRHRLARLDANYSFYVPSVSENTPTYTVPGHGDQFFAAPAHRGSVRATVRPWEGIGVTPSVVVLGNCFTKGPPDATGAQTAVEVPAQAMANLFVYREDVGIRGLRVGLGIYNIFGANYRFVHAAATTPADASAAAAKDAYLSDHAPMPGLDREILLQASYLFEPS